MKKEVFFKPTTVGKGTRWHYRMIVGRYSYWPIPKKSEKKSHTGHIFWREINHARRRGHTKFMAYPQWIRISNSGRKIPKTKGKNGWKVIPREAGRCDEFITSKIYFTPVIEVGSVSFFVGPLVSNLWSHTVRKLGNVSTEQ